MKLSKTEKVYYVLIIFINIILLVSLPTRSLDNYKIEIEHNTNIMNSIKKREKRINEKRLIYQSETNEGYKEETLYPTYKKIKRNTKKIFNTTINKFVPNSILKFFYYLMKILKASL